MAQTFIVKGDVVGCGVASSSLLQDVKANAETAKAPKKMFLIFIIIDF